MADSETPTDFDVGFEIGAAVYTPYGTGEVIEVRDDGSNQLVVQLTNGGKAYLQKDICKKKKKLFEMNDEEKMASAKQHREEGNIFFKLEDYGLANQRYELAKVYLNHLDKKDASELLSLLNNIALTCIKQGRYADAVSTCNEASANYFSPSFAEGNATTAEAKTLYLRGRANWKRGDLEAAREDYVKAVKASPQNKTIRDDLDTLLKELQKAKDKEALMFREAFKRSTSEPTKVESKESNSNHPVPAKEDKPQAEEGFFDMYGSTIGVAVAAIGLAFLFLSRR